MIYFLVKTQNQFTGNEINVILAKDLAHKYFKTFNAKNIGDQKVDQMMGSGLDAAGNLQAFNVKEPYGNWKLLAELKGFELEGIRYEQLLQFSQPVSDSFRVVIGNFVTTEDGTGIVHIAPSFGADDFRVALDNNIGSLTSLLNVENFYRKSKMEFFFTEKNM